MNDKSRIKLTGPPDVKGTAHPKMFKIDADLVDRTDIVPAVLVYLSGSGVAAKTPAPHQVFVPKGDKFKWPFSSKKKANAEYEEIMHWNEIPDGEYEMILAAMTKEELKQTLEHPTGYQDVLDRFGDPDNPVDFHVLDVTVGDVGDNGGDGGREKGEARFRSSDESTVQMVQLVRTEEKATHLHVLWELIRRSSFLLGFQTVDTYMERTLCDEQAQNEHLFHGVNSYAKLKEIVDKIMLVHIAAYRDVDPLTEAITRNVAVQTNSLIPDEISVRGNIEDYTTGTVPDPALIREYVEKSLVDDLGDSVIPYLKHVYDVKKLEAPDLDKCEGVIQSRMTTPIFCELIWSYWHEEAMLVQSMAAISLRFQNKKWRSGTGQLENLNTNPLRKLSNLLWGYIQDEPNRLSVKRRAYEYDHHYGFPLAGKAVSKMDPADSRSNFTEAFHRLLHLCSVYYREVDDTTVHADAFPVRNALRDVHLVLSEGAHNQYGDLPWTARREMLLEQWLLARPEMRSFLGGRVMVPYREAWMEAVDTMKRIQGWTDLSVEQYGTLARRGEQVLLSVRYGDWNRDALKTADAGYWAVHWRDDVNDYIHSYRAVTGVDLTQASQVDGTPPSVHLLRRLENMKGVSVA